MINGWNFLIWPDLDARWAALIRAADPTGYKSTPEARMLKALIVVVRDRIAIDPNASEFRLRGELGAWRRAKLLGRFRLFYRFSSAHQTVILAWLNDEHTLRKAGARSDPYEVFVGMLTRGEIPSDWSGLEAACSPFSGPLAPPDP